jgi:very-short-patch-repair endonuclease
MSWFVPEIIKETARNLRKNMTKSEEILWNALKLRKAKYKFLRQKPIYLYNEDSWLERYIIADFCSLELKLIIEVDGNIHNQEEIYLLDREKEKLLTQKWFRVLRFTKNEITNHLDTVINVISESFP